MTDTSGGHCIFSLQIRNEHSVGIKTTLYIELKKKNPMKTQLLYSYKCLPFCYLHICSLEWIKKGHIYMDEGNPKHYRYINTILQCSWIKKQKQTKKKNPKERMSFALRLLPIREIMSSLLWNVQWLVKCNILTHDYQRRTNPVVSILNIIPMCDTDIFEMCFNNLYKCGLFFGYEMATRSILV